VGLNTTRTYTYSLTHLLLTSSLGQDTHVWCVRSGHSCDSAVVRALVHPVTSAVAQGTLGDHLTGVLTMAIVTTFIADYGALFLLVPEGVANGTRYSSWSDVGRIAVLHQSDQRGARGIRSIRTQGREGLKSCALGAE
jgi:hypothetical protein